MKKINILIDGFSNSVINKNTGRTLKTTFIIANQLTLGAIDLGKGKMIIHEYQSEFLINKYFSDEAK